MQRAKRNTESTNILKIVDWNSMRLRWTKGFMGKSEIKVPIVKEGKDICRIIFTEFDDGLFDIKIDSLEKPFSVQSYSLFCNRPNEILTYNNHQYLQSDISYHHGAEKKPVVVHVKKRNVKEGELQYLTLPINRIVPPSNNNIFPLPLMKIEIPDISVKGSKIYKKKGYHRLVDISNSNVVEIYMAKRNFSDNFEKYSTVHFIVELNDVAASK